MLCTAFWSQESWELLAEIGCVAVIVGVIGESSELFIKWAERRRFRRFFAKFIRRTFVRIVKSLSPILLPVETGFFILLVAGLAAELLGTHMSSVIANRENSRLNKEAS